jgi:chromosome segregation ATPase
MSDAFEDQARALAWNTRPGDITSESSVQAIAIGLRETWRLARASRDAEVRALMDKADKFERSTLAGWMRASEAEEKVATTIDDAMRTANNRDMWKGQCERQAAELIELRTKVAFLEEKLNFVRELGMSFSRDAKEAQDRATLLEQTIQNGAEMILAAHARAEAAEAERDRLEAELKEIGLEPFPRKGFTRVIGYEEITPTAPSSTTESQT